MLIIGVLNNGLILTSVPTFYQLIAKGVLLIVAVMIAEQQARQIRMTRRTRYGALRSMKSCGES